MALKFILKDGLNPFLEVLFKSVHFKTRTELVNWLELTKGLCTDANDLSVSVKERSVAFCKGERPLAIWG